MDKENILNGYVKLIDKGYCEDCNELNCIGNFPHKKIASAICDLQLKNTILKQQLKKKDEIINNAIQFIQNNGEKQYNYHDNYRGKWYSPDELDTILQILEDKEV